MRSLRKQLLQRILLLPSLRLEQNPSFFSLAVFFAGFSNDDRAIMRN